MPHFPCDSIKRMATLPSHPPGESVAPLPRLLLHRLLLLGGLLLGLALRLHRLGVESLWYDETVSATLASKSVPALIAHTAGDIHPPLYYLLLHSWRALARPSLAHGLEWLYAWPSAAAGVLMLALLYVLGRRLLGKGAALAALWLAAVHPFHIWYSQEVRMYTVGGALALLCLYTALRWADPAATRRRAALAAYVAAAAAGMYTLYYFAFFLVALNVIVLCILFLKHRGHRGSTTEGTEFTEERKEEEAKESLSLFSVNSVPSVVNSSVFRVWLLAQGAAALLYAPWTGVAWRQATNPPVPPWREPWGSGGEALADVGEALAALVVGQSPPLARAGPPPAPGQFWPWALAAAALAAIALLRTRGRAQRGVWIALAAALLPTGLVLGATALGAPLYHVRYTFVWAAPFALVAAAAVWPPGACRGMPLRERRGSAALDRGRPYAQRQRSMPLWERWGGALLGAALAALSLWGTVEFWRNPAYRADDHRQAVADLAAIWRPGDAILVNAGWVYTALETYWPDGPPPLGAAVRLVDLPALCDGSGDGGVDGAAACVEGVGPRPLLVRGGSVGGAPSLGWGQPESDFFALSAEQNAAALAALAQAAPRLWHYRLYDTVSDPAGETRAWLAAHAAKRSERAYPGPGYLLVEQYDLQECGDDALACAGPGAEAGWTPVRFGEALALAALRADHSAVPGGTLYVETVWEALPGLAELPPLSYSLRLYGGPDSAIAQADGPLLPPTVEWQPGSMHRTPLALPLPAGAPAGEFSLELVVYRQEDGAPLPLAESERTVYGQRLRLGGVRTGPLAQPDGRAPAP